MSVDDVDLSVRRGGERLTARTRERWISNLGAKRGCGAGVAGKRSALERSRGESVG